MMLSRPLLSAALLLSASAPLQSQSAREDTTRRPPVTVVRSVGFSWMSTGGSAGRVTHRRVYLTELRWTSFDVTTDDIAIGFSFDLLPLVVVERTLPNRIICFDDDTRSVCHRDASARVAVGVGASPLGMNIVLNRSGRVRPQLGGAVGALIFNTEVPIYDSRRFNFRYEYGGGVEIGRKNGGAVSFGYKFFHISNGGMGRYNPGLDANVLYVGVSKSRS